MLKCGDCAWSFDLHVTRHWFLKHQIICIYSLGAAISQMNHNELQLHTSWPTCHTNLVISGKLVVKRLPKMYVVPITLQGPDPPRNTNLLFRIISWGLDWSLRMWNHWREKKEMKDKKLWQMLYDYDCRLDLLCLQNSHIFMISVIQELRSKCCSVTGWLHSGTTEQVRNATV